MKTAYTFKYLALFVALTLFDLYMTLNHTVQGPSNELNPIASILMNNNTSQIHGPSGFFNSPMWSDIKVSIYKITITAAVVLSYLKIKTVRPRAAGGVLAFGIGLFGLTAIYHMYIVYAQFVEYYALIELAKPEIIGV